MYEPYPNIHSPGWKGRIMRYLNHLIEDIDKLDTRWAQILKKNKEIALSIFKSPQPNLGAIRGISEHTWQEIAKFVAQHYSAKIDEPVTYDTKRLIRLPGSLHGGTGFKVMTIPLSDLESYDPFKEAIFFSSSIEQ